MFGKVPGLFPVDIDLTQGVGYGQIRGNTGRGKTWADTAHAARGVMWGGGGGHTFSFKVRPEYKDRTQSYTPL